MLIAIYVDSISPRQVLVSQLTLFCNNLGHGANFVNVHRQVLVFFAHDSCNRDLLEALSILLLDHTRLLIGGARSGLDRLLLIHFLFMYDVDVWVLAINISLHRGLKINHRTVDQSIVLSAPVKRFINIQRLVYAERVPLLLEVTNSHVRACLVLR